MEEGENGEIPAKMESVSVNRAGGVSGTVYRGTHLARSFMDGDWIFSPDSMIFAIQAR